ncbi:MAG TPA: hypothetical protein VMZ26_16665 [Pyrinomonadaceae bacterium]|nr:hypothetical protein [Pyrinomonadaceae bacterium]
MLSAETRALYEKNLADAEEVHLNKPNEADSIIWLGRRMAYLGRYKDAVRVFSSGLTLFKNDPRFYRHRGHRYMTLRCFDDAIRDLEIAARLVMGKPDEIEADGIPNAKNIPTSTLQSNIYYHLGLAYYMKGDWNMAAAKFMQSYNLATAAKSADMKIAAAHWVYMSAARYGKDSRRDADRLLKREVGDNENVIENDDHYKLIKLYKKQLKADDLVKEFGSMAGSASGASLGYGVGNYFLYNGDNKKAMTIFRKITAGDQWASFGYIAAEAELSRSVK